MALALIYQPRPLVVTPSLFSLVFLGPDFFPSVFLKV